MLDDRGALDGALRRWEHGRERECLETYRWTNVLGRAASMTALEVELYRAAATDPRLEIDLLDVMSRTRRPSQVLTLRRGAVIGTRAVRRAGANRRSRRAAPGR